MLAWYRYAAVAACRVAYNDSPSLPEAPEPTGHGVLEFPDPGAANDWAEIERLNVFALLESTATPRFIDGSWRLRVGYAKFLERESDRSRDIPVLKRMLALVAERGDLFAQASLNRALGVAHVLSGDAEDGLAAFERSRQLWRRLGNTSNEGLVCSNLG